MNGEDATPYGEIPTRLSKIEMPWLSMGPAGRWFGKLTTGACSGDGENYTIAHRNYDTLPV